MRSITPSSLSARSVRLGRERIAVALAQALVHQRAQVLAPRARRPGVGIARDELLAQLELDVAALGDVQRASASASGQAENASAISSVDFRKNSLVSNFSFGLSSVLLVCTHSSALWWW